MLVQCERCKVEKECRFHGRPSDVEQDKAQNGEWLCPECVPLRAGELDEAISRMRLQLGYETRDSFDEDDNEGVDL